MMKENKSLIIVTISTIAFGIIAKCFVGIPYMSLSHFDLYLVMSFILWVLYSASLYVAGEIANTGNDNLIKASFHGLIFGIIASCVKTGMDSLIMLVVGKTNNQILLTFAMEIGLLLLGSAVMLFVFFVLQKRKFTWDRSLNKFVIILGFLIGVYVIIFFSFNLKYQALTPYTDVNALTESETINLNTLLEMESIMQYSKIFTTLSMIIFVVFFIGLWFVLEKNDIGTP